MAARDVTTATMGQVIPFPVLHGRLEFAVAVRQAFEALRPDCVAVELPETLASPVIAAVERLPLLSVVHYRQANGRPVYLPVEPANPLVEALRLGLEREVPVHLVDRDVEGYGRHHHGYPDSYAVSRVGHQAYCDAVAGNPPPGERDPQDDAREEVMAWHLARLAGQHERILFVCGMAHLPGVMARLEDASPGEPLRKVRRPEVTLSHLSEKSSKEVMAEAPYLSAAYEEARGSAPALDSLDRLTEQLALTRRARAAHEENSGETVSASALGVLARFARNYALVEGRLAPDLFQILVASRGAVDDNFAYEVWELATRWPFQSDSPGLPVLELTMQDLFDHTHQIRFHRTQKTRRRSMLRLVKGRPKEARPGEWKEGWEGNAICSHQPEDLVVESYGDFLQKKAKGILSAERYRVEPFTTSLLDGVDIRETLRNWHERRLYVKEQQQVRGDVGAVIVIFDEDDQGEERYPWAMTWQGEHDQESDMAFYSTEGGAQMVGPGISRCEYGGFLLTWPPGRMYGVFEDPYFDMARCKSERLLMAGIDHSEQRLVVYVAAKPPRSRLRAVAERFGKKVVYIPLGDLSPLTLKQVRVFHVLDGHPVREWAKEYIR